MARCPECSRSIEADQRFCPACGEPQHGVELLDVSARASTGRTSTTVSRNSSSNRWFVVLALVVAGAVGWSLVSSSGDGLVSDDALDDEVGAEELDDDSLTTEPDDEAGEDETDDSVEADRNDDDPDDAEDPPVRDPFPGENGDDESGDLQNGEESEPLLPGSGLSLAVGNPLRVTDLDTGVTTETTIRASPVAVIGDHLVLRDQNGTRLVSLRLDDLDGEPTWLGRGDAGYAYRVEPAEQDGQVWILTEWWDTAEVTQLQTRVDLETGDELEERPFELDSQFWALGLMQPTDYRTPRSGGVYERDGDGFVRVTDGSLVAAGDEILLIEDCDDRLRCSLSWRQADDPTEFVDLPTPPAGDGGAIASGGVLGDDRLLVYIESFDWRYSVFDLRTGTVLVEDLEFQGDIPVSASEDGRYVAFNRHGDATVLDLETGEEVILPGGFNSGGVLLINTP